MGCKYLVRGVGWVNLTCFGLPLAKFMSTTILKMPNCNYVFSSSIPFFLFLFPIYVDDASMPLASLIDQPNDLNTPTFSITK